MVSQAELRRKMEVPSTPPKNKDGELDYPRTREGAAGDEYAYDERKEGDLPPDTSVEKEFDTAAEDQAAVALGVTAMSAQMVKRAREHQPSTLPPYVSAQVTDMGMAYVFVSPPAAREVGFEPAIVLGIDNGNGVSIGGIMEKAWGLVGQMESRMREQAERVIRDNPTVPNAPGVPPMTQESDAGLAALASVEISHAIAEYLKSYNRIAVVDMERAIENAKLIVDPGGSENGQQNVVVSMEGDEPKLVVVPSADTPSIAPSATPAAHQVVDRPVADERIRRANALSDGAPVQPTSPDLDEPEPPAPK